jgi:hypothetical protein
MPLSLAQCCLRTPARVDSRCETLERQVKECRQGRVAYQRVPGRRRSVCVDGDCCAASITPAGAPLAQFFSTTRKCKAPRHRSTRAQREDETQWQQDAHTDRYTHTHTHTHARTHARTHMHGPRITHAGDHWCSLARENSRSRQTNDRRDNNSVKASSCIASPIAHA